MRAADKLVFIASVQELLSSEETFLSLYRTAIIFAGLAIGASRLGLSIGALIVLSFLSILFILYGAGHYFFTARRLKGETPKALVVGPIFTFSLITLALLIAVIVFFFLPHEKAQPFLPPAH